MRFVFDPVKEQGNLQKHGFGFRIAAAAFLDPLGVTVFDRFENGEYRYHRIGAVGPHLRLIVVIHAYPDPEDDELVRVIGIRAATRQERIRYEENGD